MKLSDFDFDLPKELIAQEPSSERGGSSILLKVGNSYAKKPFSEILEYLRPNDLIVFNNSKVIKSRLILTKNSKEVVLYLNKPLRENIWHGFAKPAKKLHVGDIFTFGSHKISIHSKGELGNIEVKLELDKISAVEFFDLHGTIPLPPYIKRISSIEDEDRYQNVYAENPGSVAASTAGLHFTTEMINKIKDKDIEIAFVTLHVGAGTFLPVKTEDIEMHKMHSENYSVDKKNADIINNAKDQGRRIISVGTTSLRVLESWNRTPGEFETNIFIRPGFRFNMVDCLITNFHLPKSTLFILACAFAGYDTVKSAYAYAIEEKMRFFSYGDAMFLEKMS